jgi:hypothetical protein
MNSKEVLGRSYRVDRFAFVLSLYGASAFAMFTLTPTLLDPLLHNPLYGTRTYPLGPWVTVFSVLVFAFIYKSNTVRKDVLRLHEEGLALNRAVLSFLSLLVPMIIVLPNFLPELPHMWVLSHTILYGASIAFTSFVYNHKPDYKYVQDDEIDPDARIESIRMSYNSYYVGLALLVAIGAGAVTSTSLSIAPYLRSEELIMIHMASEIDLAYLLAGLVCGLAFQMFAGMSKAQQQLRKIKGKKPRKQE